MDDCTNKDVTAFKIFLKYLRDVSDYGINDELEAFLKEELNRSFSFMSHPIASYKFPKLQRLTINRRVIGANKRLYSVSHLKYPPTKFVTKYGRCNLPSQSVLYAAFDGLTVLNELKPKRGDVITVSTWESIDDTSLTISPILRQPNNGTVNPRIWDMEKHYANGLTSYPPNIKVQIELLNEFVADMFTKSVDSNNDKDYLFSAFFANRILNEYENGKVDAIFYPSVQSHLCFENLAIKPNVFDNKYRLTEVKESVVDMDLTAGTRGVMMLGIGDANQFDFESDRILWSETVRQPVEQMEYIINTYGYEL